MSAANEDGPEDTGTAPVCGHNGSLRPYVHNPAQAAPCPPEVRRVLEDVRARLARQVAARRVA